MAENIGEASVKITADISQLEAKIQEAKSAAQNLGSFTVNTEGFSGSLEEYNKWLEKANEEVQTHEEYLEGVARAMEEVESSAQRTTEPIAQTNEEVRNQIGFFENLKDRAVQVGDAIEGSFLRAKDTIQNTDRIGRTALIGLATAVTAFAKSSIDEYAKYNENFAKSQEATEKAISRLKASIGAMLAPVVNVLGGLAQWISENQQLVTGLFTMVSIIGGAAGIIALVKKLTTAVAALKATAGGIIGLIAGLVGLFVGLNTETQDFSYTTEELLQQQEEQEKQAKALEKAYDSYGGSLDDVSDRIAEIREQMEKATRQYRQNLKQILVNHEETVAKLTDQIREANADYQRAVDERNAAFAVSQAKEEAEHQEKVDALVTQINFLQRYNNRYNQEKLSQLQFALAKENRLYEDRTKAEREQLDIQLANERAKYDEKIIAYQQELDEELGFLNKHRELLNGVRGEILDDEVESLTRQYNEQMASYQKQIESARESGMAAAANWANAYNDTLNSSIPSFQNAGKTTGNAFGGGFFSTVGGWLDNLFSGFMDWFNRMNGGVERKMKELIEQFKYQSGFMESGGSAGYGFNYGSGGIGRANGGYTGPGGKWEVADDIVVHRGEYVLPQEMVDQTTHLPKSMGNITINVSGTFATSATERRKVAQDIVNALGQTNYARLGV